MRSLLPLLLILLMSCTFSVDPGEIPCRDDSYCPSDYHCEGNSEEGEESRRGVCVEGPSDDDDSADDDDATPDDDDATPDDDDATPDDDDATPDDDDATESNPGVFISEFYLGLGDLLQDRGWVEITNTTGEAVEIEGMRMTFLDQEWTIEESGTIEPGTAVVFGRSADTSDNGGVEVAAAWGEALNFGVVEAVEEIPFTIFDADGAMLDTVTASAAMPVAEGVSTSLGQQHLNADDNDDPDNWCFTQVGAFGSGFGFGDPGAINTPCPGDPVPGTLVITEMLLSPGDSGRQWIEVVNASSDRRSLKGLEVGVSSSAAEIVDHALMHPGGYAVFSGGQANENQHGFNSTFAWPEQIVLSPAGDTVSIKFGNTEIDAVDYSDASFDDFRELFAQSFALPEAEYNDLSNDDGSLWCAHSGEPFNDAGDIGSPLEANPDCVGAGQSVVITEFFFDLGGQAPGSQWIELRNTTNSPIQLQNWRIETADWSHTINANLMIAAHDQVVLAQSMDAADNAGLQPDYAYGTNLALDDFSQYVSLRDAASGHIDTVDFSSADFPAPHGGSVAFGGDDSTAEPENDDPNNWCTTTWGLYGDESFYGSPHEPNGGCPGVTQEHELIITEAMIQPFAQDEGDGEWIEIHSHLPHTISLEGYVLETLSGSSSHEIDLGILLQPGGFVVLGGSLDEVINGGLLADYQWGQDLTLNFGDGVRIRNPDAGLIDELDWSATGMPAPDQLMGVSVSLDPSAFTHPDDDDPDNYCASPAGYYNGSENQGTPGWDNPSCGFGGDDDDSFGDDDDATADDDDSFGDDDDSFGDDDDSVILDSYQVGDLIITEILYDPNGSDTNKEWFEVFNAAPYDINLDDWDIVFGSAGVSRNIAAPIVIASGASFVLGQSNDTGQNGGLTVAWAYDQPSAPALDNVSDELSLYDGLGNFIDAVSWDEGFDWPDVEGHTLSLDPALVDSVTNDHVEAWCETPAFGYGNNGDHGSPGSFNESCNDPWWDGMGFCMDFSSFGASPSSMDVAVHAVVASEPWIFGIQSVDVPGNSLSGMAATTPFGSCQDDVNSGFVPISGAPDSFGTSIVNTDDLVLSGIGDDLVIENAVLDGEFMEGSWTFEDVSLSGDFHTQTLQPQYPGICTDFTCFTCSRDPSQQCIYAVLNGGMFFLQGAM